MVDIAQYINEVKRDSDTLQIMNDVQVIIINIDYCKKCKIIFQNVLLFAITIKL